jgi:hypothetical protein
VVSGGEVREKKDASVSLAGILVILNLNKGYLVISRRGG